MLCVCSTIHPCGTHMMTLSALEAPAGATMAVKQVLLVCPHLVLASLPKGALVRDAVTQAKIWMRINQSIKSAADFINVPLLSAMTC